MEDTPQRRPGSRVDDSSPPDLPTEESHAPERSQASTKILLKILSNLKTPTSFLNLLRNNSSNVSSLNERRGANFRDSSAHESATQSRVEQNCDEQQKEKRPISLWGRQRASRGKDKTQRIELRPYRSPSKVPREETAFIF